MGASGDDEPPTTTGRDTLASIDEETKVDGILQSEILAESTNPRRAPALDALPTIEMTSAELRTARATAGAPSSVRSLTEGSTRPAWAESDQPPPSIVAIHAALYGEAPPPSVRPPPVVGTPIVSSASPPSTRAPTKVPSAAPAATLAEEMSRQIGEHMSLRARDRPPRAEPSFAPPPALFAPPSPFRPHLELDDEPDLPAAPARRTIRRSVVLPWPAIAMLIAIATATIVEHAWRGDLVETILGSLHAARLFFEHLW